MCNPLERRLAMGEEERRVPRRGAKSLGCGSAAGGHSLPPSRFEPPLPELGFVAPRGRRGGGLVVAGEGEVGVPDGGKVDEVGEEITLRAGAVVPGELTGKAIDRAPLALPAEGRVDDGGEAVGSRESMLGALAERWRSLIEKLADLRGRIACLPERYPADQKLVSLSALLGTTADSSSEHSATKPPRGAGRDFDAFLERQYEVISRFKGDLDYIEVFLDGYEATLAPAAAPAPVPVAVPAPVAAPAPVAPAPVVAARTSAPAGHKVAPARPVEGSPKSPVRISAETKKQVLDVLTDERNQRVDALFVQAIVATRVREALNRGAGRGPRLPIHTVRSLSNRQVPDATMASYVTSTRDTLVGLGDAQVTAAIPSWLKNFSAVAASPSPSPRGRR